VTYIYTEKRDGRRLKCDKTRVDDNVTICIIHWEDDRF
jgi:hypothetical protein